jgi:disulfide bond formation protein DsbB
MVETLLRDLRQPEYIHVLINPLPIYGLAISLIGLIVALFLRNRPAQVTALVTILIAAASAWPVVHYGEEAYDRVLSMADEDGQAWLEAHKQRAEELEYVFYALAALAASAIFLPKKWPATATPLVITTLILALISLGAGAYIANAGGKIRHREFRNRPPPRSTPAQEQP